MLSTSSPEREAAGSSAAAGERYWTRPEIFLSEGSRALTCRSRGEPLTASTFFSPAGKSGEYAERLFAARNLHMMKLQRAGVLQIDLSDVGQYMHRGQKRGA